MQLGLHDFQFRQILAVNETDRFTGLVHYDQVIDFMGFKHSEGIHSERVGANGFWALGHKVFYGFLQKPRSSQSASTEIAIGENPGELA